MRARPPRLGVGLAVAAAVVLGACGETRVAGTGAGGEPEALCPAYCTLFLRRCIHQLPTWSSPAACDTACGAIPSRGALGDTRGDSVACRLTYLLAASDAEPMLCLFAQPEGSPACL